MGIVDALILGIVQGLTEFLPVSSTGHLILARDFLGLEVEGGLAFDAVLHFATAGAVVWYFFPDLWKLALSLWGWLRGEGIARTEQILFFALLVGTLPAVILGLLFEDAIAGVFRSAEMVAWALLAGSVLFVVAEEVAKRRSGNKELSVQRGMLVGCFQALALIPGMSRSGATISGGLLLGFTREQAARFAFLLSLPVILGAGTLKALELGTGGIDSLPLVSLSFGVVAAFVSGLAAIHFLIRFLKHHSLYWFVGYRIVLAVLVLCLV